MVGLARLLIGLFPQLKIKHIFFFYVRRGEAGFFAIFCVVVRTVSLQYIDCWLD